MYLVLLRRMRFFTSQRFHRGRARPPCLRGTIKTTTVCFNGMSGQVASSRHRGMLPRKRRGAAETGDGLGA